MHNYIARHFQIIPISNNDLPQISKHSIEKRAGDK